MAGTAMRVNVSRVSSSVHPFSSEGMLRSPGSPVSCPSSPSHFWGQRLSTASSPRESMSPVANAGARAYAATEERVEARFGSTKNLYDLLSVSKNATPTEIKAAYRMAARRLHPDVVPEEQRLEATKSFLEVRESYSILTNPQTRAAYDLSLSMNSFQSGGFSNRGPVSYGTPAWGFSSSPVSSSNSYHDFSFKGHNWETDQCW